MNNRQKVVIIGIDAMSPEVVKRLIAKRVLPNFAKLHFSYLSTTTPPETPVAWSAAATGNNPGQYGIYDFIDRNPETYLPRLCLTEEKSGLIKTEYKSCMKGLPFWKILNEKGINTTIIRWPVTFPAEEVKGRMFAGLGTVDISGALNSYSFFTNDPNAVNGKGAEKVILLPCDKAEFSTYIQGPTVRKRGIASQIRAQLKLIPSGKNLLIKSGNTEIEISPNTWSPFFRVAFEVLPFHFVKGICKAYLVSSYPDLKLYLSSVQIDPADQAYPLTFPKEYGSELENQIGLFYTLGMPEETKAVTEGKLPFNAFIEQINEIEQQREAHLKFEINRFKDGLLAFIFDAGDRLQHLTWEPLEEGNNIVPQAIEDYYISKDRLLGEITELIDNDTKLIIMSDHGFSTFSRQVNINRWLLENGYLKCTQEADMNSELFKAVDWNSTKAYAVGFTSLYLNLKGREKSGIVENSEIYQILQEIKNGLLKLQDGASKVVNCVYFGKDIYSGEYSQFAPDIVIGFAPGYRMSSQSVIGGVGECILANNDSLWKADHLIDSNQVPGVLFTNFKTSKLKPAIIDIAPTVLDLFGINDIKFDGESLL